MSRRMMAGEAARAKIQRRFLPFALVGLLAPLTAVIPPQPEEWTLVWIAAALTVAIALVGLLTPWSRLPRWTYIVAAARVLRGGRAPARGERRLRLGIRPLALLPIVWIALNLGRTQVAIGIAAGIAVFVLPLLVGDPESYTSSDWRRAVLWAAVGGDRRLLGRVARAREAQSARAQAARARTDDCRHRRRRARVDGGGRRTRSHLPCDARDRRRGPCRDLGAGRAWQSRAHGSCRNGSWPLTASNTSTRAVGHRTRVHDRGRATSSPTQSGTRTFPRTRSRRTGVVSMFFEPIVQAASTDRRAERRLGTPRGRRRRADDPGC